MNMQAAIDELEIFLHTLETNEPINRAQGNIAQADAELQSADQVRRALALLKQ